MKHVLSGILFITSLGNSVYAQEVLSLNDVVRLALERNEQMKISRFQVDKAKNEVKMAKSTLFPVIGAEAQALRTKQEPALIQVPGGGSLFDNWQNSATISLRQPVYSFGKIRGAVDSAKSSLELADAKNQVTESEIKAVAQTLYYNILYYKAFVDISEKSYANAKKNSEALSQRVSYGRISQIQNLKMKADLASREPRVLSAKRSLESLKLELKSFLNYNGDLKVKGTIADDHQEVAPKALDIDFSSLAVVKSLKSQFDLSSSLAELESKNYFPDLSFFASYGKVGYYEDFMSNNFLNQANISLGLVLSFEIPTGGTKSYQQTIANKEKRIAGLNYEYGKRNLERQMEDLNQKYQKLEKELVTLANAVKLSENSYQVALRSFSAGSTTQLQLNDSELLLTQNRLALAASRLEHRLIQVELEKLGTEFKEGKI